MKLVVGDSQRSTSVLTPLPRGAVRSAENRPLSLSPSRALTRFAFLPFTFPLSFAVPLSYRIVKPLFSLRTAGQKESSCSRLPECVSCLGDFHDCVIQLGRGHNYCSRYSSETPNLEVPNFPLEKKSSSKMSFCVFFLSQVHVSIQNPCTIARL